MKKLIFALFLVLLSAQNTTAGFKKEVVIFSQPCHFCEKMKEALNSGIIAANPDIKFTILDLQEAENYQLLQKYAAIHRLRGDIGLPLLFAGENYMMGWGPDSAEVLAGYLDELRHEQVSRIPVKP